MTDDEARELRREMTEQRKALDECRQKLAIANQSSEYWRERALRRERDDP